MISSRGGANSSAPLPDKAQSREKHAAALSGGIVRLYMQRNVPRGY
jgi:hypothetical protein